MTERRLSRHFAAAGAATLLAVAHQPASAATEDFVFAPSVVVDFTFGDAWNVGLGFDLRATALVGLQPGVCNGPAQGIGVYARSLWLLRGGAPRFAAGLHGGFHEHPGAVSWDFEAGWLWQGRTTQSPGGHGLQVGLLTSLGVFDLAARVSVLAGGDGWYPQSHLALGGRYVSPFGLGPGSGCRDIRFL